MPLLSEHHDPGELGDRLRDADAVTAELMSDIIDDDLPALSVAGPSRKDRADRTVDRSQAPGPMPRWR